MYCSQCGKAVNEGAKFCEHCGCIIQDSGDVVKTIVLKCKNCSATMETDSEKPNIMYCTYCGSKELIKESDNVASERIRKDAEIEKENIRKSLELEKMKAEAAKEEAVITRKNSERFRKGKLCKISIVFIIICIFLCAFCFWSHRYIAGVIAGIQAALFLATIVVGIAVSAPKKRFVFFIPFIVGLGLIVPFFNTMNDIPKPSMEWPQSGICTVIPKPDSSLGEIIINTSDDFSALVYGVTKEQFNSYLEKCKSEGFTIDGEDKFNGYKAFSNEGFCLDLSYYSSDNEMAIFLDAPIKFTNIDWDSYKLSKNFPKPDSNMGKVVTSRDDYFFAYVNGISKSGYKDYVSKCEKMGYNIDKYSIETSFCASNAQNYEIHVSYSGNNTISIEITANEKVKETEAAKTQAETSIDTEEFEETISDSGSEKETTDNSIVPPELIRPEIKKTLDDYEAFFKSYCDFMKKYSNSDNQFELIGEYLDFIQKEIDMLDSFNNIDQSDFTDAETAYYLEINLRITKMLTETVF